MITDTAAPTGFLGWIQANGQLVLFFAQLLYWVVISIAALWATLLFRKLVLAKTAGDASSAPLGASGVSGDRAGMPPSASSVSVDEFVD